MDLEMKPDRPPFLGLLLLAGIFGAAALIGVAGGAWAGFAAGGGFCGGGLVARWSDPVARKQWFMGLAAFLAVCGLFMLSSCGYSVTPSADGPDRVSNVILKCEARTVADGNITYRPENGAKCSTGTVRNVRQVVTVKTAKGTTYEVDVDAKATVMPGSEWPPK